MRINPVVQTSKCLGEITLAEVQAEGYPSRGVFIEAWLDIFGYWDPQQTIQLVSIRRIA